MGYTRKGIILAGGYGSRLFPLTKAVNKQLLPVFDKPMIYYPLTTLVSCGIQDVCIISSYEYLPLYRELFDDGSQWGLTITYRLQPDPKGLPQAFTIAEDHLGDANILILGDNIFHGFNFFPETLPKHDGGGEIWAYEVEDPRRYGVVVFGADGNLISLEEKPTHPASNYAVPGIYMFDNRVAEYAKQLVPSARGELEIVDLIKKYAETSRIHVQKMPRGSAWLDAGTPESLSQASLYVQTIQSRQGIMIGCVEEECLRQKFITEPDIVKLLATYPKCAYRDYLEKIL
jgi:glucose-1-phosphate thymidylyltransferase